MSLKEKLLSPIIWVNLLLMLLVMIALCIGVWIWLGNYTHHGEEIEVPNVEGKLLGDVEYTLEMIDLQPIVVDSTYNRSMPSGAIMTQLPKAGSKVKSGREIYLTINSHQSPTIPLPDIADNCSLREAQDRLRQLGFRLGPIEEVDGDKDWVYGVKCMGRTVMAGERVPADATITLLVGSNQDESDPNELGEDEENSNSQTDIFDYD